MNGEGHRRLIALIVSAYGFDYPLWYSHKSLLTCIGFSSKSPVDEPPEVLDITSCLCLKIELNRIGFNQIISCPLRWEDDDRLISGAFTLTSRVMRRDTPELYFMLPVPFCYIRVWIGEVSEMSSRLRHTLIAIGYATLAIHPNRLQMVAPFPSALTNNIRI